MCTQDANGLPYKGPIDTLQRVLQEGNERVDASGRRLGSRILMSGVEPRVMWISIGGFVFFGAYEFALRWTRPLFEPAKSA
jgi:solute carrier family 25 S-adenosylmethionine transporter 26